MAHDTYIVNTSTWVAVVKPGTLFIAAEKADMLLVIGRLAHAPDMISNKRVHVIDGTTSVQNIRYSSDATLAADVRRDVDDFTEKFKVPVKVYGKSIDEILERLIRGI